MQNRNKTLQEEEWIWNSQYRRNLDSMLPEHPWPEDYKIPLETQRRAVEMTNNQMRPKL